MKHFFKVFIITTLFYSCSSNDIQEKGMILYKIEHFNIYHEGESEKTLEDIENVLNQTYNVVLNFFKIEPEKTNIYFYKDQKTFQGKNIQ
jgi:hypothetical protein